MTCNPASGTTFPVGTTTVMFVADVLHALGLRSSAKGSLNAFVKKVAQLTRR